MAHDPRGDLSRARASGWMKIGAPASMSLGRSDLNQRIQSRLKPEDGKTHLRQSASSACSWSGAIFAEGIVASCHVCRTNRSNTWPHHPPRRAVQRVGHRAIPVDGSTVPTTCGADWPRASTTAIPLNGVYARRLVVTAGRGGD